MRKLSHRWAPVALAVLLTMIAIGCGKQDLYELPDSPYTEIGRLPLPTINYEVDVLGDYAYVAAGQAGFHVVDISDPSDPVLVTTLNTTRDATSIHVVRTFVDHEILDMALCSEGTEGIRTYDVTDPANPVDFDQATTAINARDFDVSVPDDPDEPFLVVLAEDWKGIRFFASDPAFPGVLAYGGVFATTWGEAQDVAYKDGYVYVADDQMGLTVMDARVLALGAVVIAAQVDTPGNAIGIAIEGDYAYIADKRQGLAIFDIGDPTDPVHIAQMPLDSWALDVVVRDHLVFVAADDAGMHIIDVSDPASPRYAGNVRSANGTGVTVTKDGLVLLTDEDDGLRIMRGRAFADETPPAGIYHLRGESVSTSAVSLTWYATGDDGYVGQAAGFMLRYAPSPIEDEAGWDAATPVTDLPLPGEVGTEHTLTVGGLAGDTTYHFAARALDADGNLSPLAPSTAVNTFPEGTFLSNLSVTPEFGDAEQLYTFEVTYSDTEGDEPVTSDIEIDGAGHAMTYVSGDYDTGALYRYETLLDAGPHAFRALFDDGDGHAPVTDTADGPLVGEIAFVVGSPLGELGRDEDEDQYDALITRTIVAEAEEVSQAEWITLMGGNPSTFVGADLPVEGVTWYEAIDYCNARSLDEGLTLAYAVDGLDVAWNREADGWRLPTEAEWEWLCRADTETAFFGGPISDETGDDPLLDTLGWYLGNSGETTHEGAQRLANGFGAYDTHGNVMEWCWDWYAGYPDEPTLDPEGPAVGFAKVIRGGSWFHQAKQCRSAAREKAPPSSATDFIGFRVVRTIGE